MYISNTFLELFGGVLKQRCNVCVFCLFTSKWLLGCSERLLSGIVNNCNNFK